MNDNGDSIVSFPKWTRATIKWDGGIVEGLTQCCLCEVTK